MTTVEDLSIPHNIEAEQQLLGALLLSNDRLDLVADLIRAEHFYEPLHADIFDRIVGRVNAGQIASPVTLRSDLQNHHALKELGGPAYLVRLAGGSISAFAARDYAQDIVNAAAKRKLLEIGLRAQELITMGEQTAAEIAIEIENSAGAVAASSEVRPLVRSHVSTITGAVRQINDAHVGNTPPGTSTGLPQLDAALGYMRPGNLIIAAGRPSMGKAQPIDEPVHTPSGWKRIGDLAVGDEVTSIDGKTSRVTGVFPQGLQRAYRVTFSDGRWTRCCGDHLWQVSSSRFSGVKVLRTKDLAQKLERVRYRGRLFVPRVSGLHGRNPRLQIDPWLIGYLLGNGYLQYDAVRVSTADADILAAVRSRLPQNLSLKHVAAYDYGIVGERNNSPNHLIDALRFYKLAGKRSHEKFVPDAYLAASREYRLSVLRGLMDADGWVEKFGVARFGSTSRMLAEHVVYLVRSLGGMATINKRKSYLYKDGDRKACLDSYTVNVQMPDESPFELQRKSARLCGRRRPAELRIRSIEAEDICPQVCISVSHPSRLYVTRDFIVTHNTTVAQNIAFSAASTGIGVFFGSFEMLGEELTNRFLSLGLATRGKAVPYSRMIQGNLSDDEMRLVVEEGQRQIGLPIHYAERDARDMRKLRSAIRRARQIMSDTETPLGLIVIDYIQQLTHPNAKSVYDRASMASDFAKGVAMDFGVPVLALAQLSREVERRDPPVPMLSDLRESGKIEEDADVVFFTYRDSYYLQRKIDALGDKDIDQENDLRVAMGLCRDNIDLIIAKQRSGATRTVQAYIRPDLCQVSKDKADFAGELI